MKRLLICLLIALLLPAAALADWTMEFEKNYVIFPDLDGMKVHLTRAKEWTIVTAATVDDHLERMLRRGDSEEEIRSRFAEESLIFEAYSDNLPKDACARMEIFENEQSRSIWHLQHLSTKERKQLLTDMEDGLILPRYDVYSLKYAGTGSRSYITGWFTTIPPEVHESGRISIVYRDGRAYVSTYVVRERLAGRSRLLGKGELDKSGSFTHADQRPSFATDLKPQLTSFEVDKDFPHQVGLGDVEISGKVQKGGKLTITLDGKEISAKVDKKGNFTATLPLDTPGDHEVIFTASHKKYTQRVETYTINASDHRTALTITDYPEELALAGDQLIAGETDPGAEITLRLDEQEAVTITADEAGKFSYTFEVLDNWYHLVTVTARAQDKDKNAAALVFTTEYETIKKGIKAFQKNLTEHSIAKMAKDPDEYKGERVKISVKVKEIRLTDEGLGILCSYNPASKKAAKTPLYLRLYGYAQDQIYEGMTITIYGQVTGLEEVEGEEPRLGILVHYGTYLTSK